MHLTRVTLLMTATCSGQKSRAAALPDLPCRRPLRASQGPAPPTCCSCRLLLLGKRGGPESTLSRGLGTSGAGGGRGPMPLPLARHPPSLSAQPVARGWQHTSTRRPWQAASLLSSQPPSLATLAFGGRPDTPCAPAGWQPCRLRLGRGAGSVCSSRENAAHRAVPATPPRWSPIGTGGVISATLQGTKGPRACSGARPAGDQQDSARALGAVSARRPSSMASQGTPGPPSPHTGAVARLRPRGPSPGPGLVRSLA